MDDYRYVDISKLGCGFTNQLGYIVTGLVSSIYEGKSGIIVSNFLERFDQESYRPISEIIDLNHINRFLEKYHVSVIDINNVNYKILSIKYGTYWEAKDIQLELLHKSHPNGLILKAGTMINDVFGDSYPGHRKTLFVVYSLNGTIHRRTYPEILNEPLELHFNQSNISPIKSDQCWISRVDIPLYDEIMVNIQFKPEFYYIASNIWNKFKQKVNILHLRDDDDAIKFWGNINGMHEDVFSKLLCDKYIYLINKYVDPEQSLVVLTSNLFSPVITYLQNEGYTYHTTPKEFGDKRELNAIIDLLVAENANGTFIGNTNPINFHGSTYSYLLWKRLKKIEKAVLIDLDVISSSEVVILNC